MYLILAGYITYVIYLIVVINLKNEHISGIFEQL